MLRYLTVLLCLLILSACRPAQDEEFQVLFKNFQERLEKEPLLRAFLEQQLVFDSLLILEPNKVDQLLSVSKNELATLHQFKLERLNPELHPHYDNLHSFLTIVIKHIETDRIHETNPDFYKILPYLKKLDALDNSEALSQQLARLELYFQGVIRHLKKPAVERLEQTVTESIAAYEYLSDAIEKPLKTWKLDSKRTVKLTAQLSRTQLSIKDYIAYCNSKLFDANNQALK